MKPHKINQLAIWKPMRGDEMNIKVYPDKYPYMKNGVLFLSTSLEPVVRYAKNFEKVGQRFSLCMVTLEKDTAKIEEWMETRSKKVKSADIDGTFKLLEVYYKG